MFLRDCSAHSRLHPLFALFGKLEDGLSGSFGDLVVWDEWVCYSTANDRVFSSGYRTAVIASRANSGSTLVLCTSPPVRHLDQLPWIVFLRARTCRTISI